MSAKVVWANDLHKLPDSYPCISCGNLDFTLYDGRMAYYKMVCSCDLGFPAAGAKCPMQKTRDGDGELYHNELSIFLNSRGVGAVRCG